MHLLRTILGLALLPCTAFAVTPMSDEERLKTGAERSDFSETDSAVASYALLEELAARSPDLRMQTFGLTPEGREIKWLLATSGADEAEPGTLEDTSRLLLIAGIHSGEIEGKDAGIMLLRELTENDGFRWPYPGVSLAFVPIFNLDGHERRSPFNRINQNGPTNMGWRGTAQRYNLNRDFLKADTPEMRALLGLWNQFDPHLVYDSHTTDGADYQYDLTWHLEQFDLLDAGLRSWQRGFFFDTVFPAVDKRDHLLTSYPEPIDHSDLRKGVSYFVSTAKYSTGYAAARNRPVLLIETHMLKDYRTRVRATKDLLDESLKALQSNGKRLRDAVAAADQRAAALAGQDVVLLTRSTGKSETLPFKGFAYQTRKSEFSGESYAEYDAKAAETFDLPFFFEQEPAVTVTLPAAYVIPPSHSALAAKLDRHGIEWQRLPLALQARVAEDILSEPVFAPSSFDGQVQLTGFKRTTREQDRLLPAGSLLVPVAQPHARLIAHLLEPEAPDSLLRRGEFNLIFEQREYAEPRVAEKLAAELSAANPDLKAEFEQRLESDAAFAASPFARMNWWFMRSEWAEQDLGLYPVRRMDIEALEALNRALSEPSSELPLMPHETGPTGALP